MNDHEYKPEGIIANLQALFAVMEFSNRKAVDPNDFITKLGLDPAVQQDAQEFCKLFQGVLESKLSSQINATVKGMIQVWSFALPFSKFRRIAPQNHRQIDRKFHSPTHLSFCFAASGTT